MKKRTVIVTRDDGGYMDIWPSNANPTKDKDGIYWDKDVEEIVQGDCVVRPFKAIFGFTPPKGSKRVLNFTVED